MRRRGAPVITTGARIVDAHREAEGQRAKLGLARRQIAERRVLDQASGTLRTLSDPISSAPMRPTCRPRKPDVADLAVLW